MARVPASGGKILHLRKNQDGWDAILTQGRSHLLEFFMPRQAIQRLMSGLHFEGADVYLDRQGEFREVQIKARGGDANMATVRYLELLRACNMLNRE